MTLFQASKNPMPITRGQLEMSGNVPAACCGLIAAHHAAHREESTAEQGDEQRERTRPAPDPSEQRPVHPDVLEHPVPSRPEPEKEEPERLEPASEESKLEVPLGPEARRRVQPDDGGHVSGCQRLPVRFRLCVHPRLQGLELNLCCRTVDDALCDPRHAHEEQKGEDRAATDPERDRKG